MKMPSALRCALTFASISPGRRMALNPAAGGEDLSVGDEAGVFVVLVAFFERLEHAIANRGLVFRSAHSCG